MTDTNKLIKDFLKQTNVMQLATSVNNVPWACNVHFFADDDLNLYWISSPNSQHSKEIDTNPHVAVAIKVHENTPEEDYIIGFSIAGTAEKLEELPADEIIDGYIAKHTKHPRLKEDIRGGNNPNKFYKLTPSRIVLIDSKNFPDQPRQEVK